MQPEIALGIHLPTTGAAWILDDQDGKQELVRVRHSLGTWNRHTGKNTARSFGWPFVGQVTSLDLAHPNADVQVHANAPIFFLRQTVRDQEELDDPSRGKGQYSIVHLKTDGQIRVVSRFIFDSLSKPQRAPDLIDTKVEVLANASGWMKIEPAKPLIPGHYAVVYMLSNSEQIDDDIYDFDVKP